MKKNKHERSEVEINYMKRIGTEQFYFELWVRSATRPEIKQGTIIERGPDERRQIMQQAARLAGALMDQYGDGKQDPDRTAVSAGGAYDRLNSTNPIPRVSDERPV